MQRLGDWRAVALCSTFVLGNAATPSTTSSLSRPNSRAHAASARCVARKGWRV
jgi:hypothetical protein